MPQLYGQDWSRADLERHIGNFSQVAGIRPAQLIEGRAAGVRVLDVEAGDGLVFTVVPDRCLDIAKLTYRGVPLCWQAQSGCPPVFRANRRWMVAQLFWGCPHHLWSAPGRRSLRGRRRGLGLAWTHCEPARRAGGLGRALGRGSAASLVPGRGARDPSLRGRPAAGAGDCGGRGRASDHCTRPHHEPGRDGFAIHAALSLQRGLSAGSGHQPAPAGKPAHRAELRDPTGSACWAGWLRATAAWLP